MIDFENKVTEYVSLPNNGMLEHSYYHDIDSGDRVFEYWKESYNGRLANETNGSHIYKGYLYNDNGECIFEYDASKHGAVVAIRIEFDDLRQSIATLAFFNHPPVKINWCHPNERVAFKYGINGYTVIIDKRYNHDFENYFNKCN